MAPVRFRPPKVSRILVRLLAFNLLLLFLPVAGILYLDVYETRLLEAQERSMVQQARLLAAALSDRDPIEPAAAGELLNRLNQRSDARLRVFDSSAKVLADSNSLQFAGEEKSPGGSYPPASRAVRARALYRVGALIAAARRRFVAWTFPIVVPRPTSSSPALVDSGTPPEVLTALGGRYGAATRPTPGQRSLTLNSAVPVRRRTAVTGVVLVSQSTFRVLQALYDVRLRIFEVVVASMLAAAALTALAAATIVRPLARLRREASDLAERRNRLPGHFEDAVRRDELGDLARSLQELTRRLDEHIRAAERFASDVSHEFRNPLAAIRSAAEMAGQAETVEERRKFLAMLTRDADRLERLVSGVRELAVIDAELEHETPGRVEVMALLQQVVDGLRLAQPALPDVAVRNDAGPVVVRASADRLAQVFENVLANARSFAPSGTTVDVIVTTDPDGCCRIDVCDRGPGIPQGHLERVFDRFFSYRPGEAGADRSHTGLGLAIARSIVTSCGGTIAASNRTDGGARFEIKLPRTTRTDTTRT